MLSNMCANVQRQTLQSLRWVSVSCTNIVCTRKAFRDCRPPTRQLIIPFLQRWFVCLSVSTFYSVSYERILMKISGLIDCSYTRNNLLKFHKNYPQFLSNVTNREADKHIDRQKDRQINTLKNITLP